MASDMAELLKKSRREIPRTQLPPAGLGIFRAGKATYTESEEEGKSDRVSIAVRYVRPHPDSGLSEDAVNASDYEGFFKSFFLDGNAALNDLWDYLEAMGISDDIPTQEALTMTDGREFAAVGKHGTRKDTGAPDMRLYSPRTLG